MITIDEWIDMAERNLKPPKKDHCHGLACSDCPVRKPDLSICDMSKIPEFYRKHNWRRKLDLI
jgi:hypothetical protein